MQYCGTVEIVKHSSTILTDNVLNDPTLRNLVVYLPPSYSKNADAYQTIYVLPSFAKCPLTYLNSFVFAKPLIKLIDEAIVSNEIEESIYVFPDCSTRYGTSQYINSKGNGRYQDYFIDEIVSYVDHHYRTIQAPSHRMLLGRSSGGYGAFYNLLTRPDVFLNAGCIAPDCGFEYCYLPFVPHVLNTFEKFGGHRNFIDTPQAIFPKSADYIQALSLIAMANCYSPGDTTSSDSFKFVCDMERGEFSDDIWDIWKSYDPLRLINKYEDNIKKAKFLSIYVGKEDEHHMRWGSRALSDKLKDRNIPHIYQETNGGHEGNENIFLTIIKEYHSYNKN